MVVEIKENEDGYYFIVPEEIVEKYDLKEGDELEIESTGNSIFIKA